MHEKMGCLSTACFAMPSQRHPKARLCYNIVMIVEPESWELYDRYGNKIYMTTERWLHAQEKRPWLSDYLDEVLATIRYGRRQQDPLNPQKYKYYRPISSLEPDYNHLVAIVLFKRQVDESGQLIHNNYVVNVWAVYIYGRR
jgi:hypothetical protein